jgi:hypothetical protein
MEDKVTYRKHILDIQAERNFSGAELCKELGMSWNCLMRVLDPENTAKWANKTLRKVEKFIQRFNNK